MMADPPDDYPEDIQDAFEYCSECETVVVSLDQHTCSDGRTTGHKSAEERARLAALDNRPLKEDVLYPQGRSHNNAWAYHELDDSGDPLHELNHESGANTGPRQEAIDQGCYPCGKCRLLAQGYRDE